MQAECLISVLDANCFTFLFNEAFFRRLGMLGTIILHHQQKLATFICFTTRTVIEKTWSKFFFTLG